MEASYIVYFRRGDPASEACIPYCIPGLFYLQDIDELKHSLMAQGRSLPTFLKGIPTVCTNEQTPKVWVGSNAQALIHSVYEAAQKQDQPSKRARVGGAPPRHVPTHRPPREDGGGSGGGGGGGGGGGRAPSRQMPGGANTLSGAAASGEAPTQMHSVDVPMAPPSGPAAAGCTVNDELFNIRFNRKDNNPEDSGSSLNELMTRYNQGR